jgi:hypothetical protein
MMIIEESVTGANFMRQVYEGFEINMKILVALVVLPTIEYVFAINLLCYYDENLFKLEHIVRQANNDYLQTALLLVNSLLNYQHL